MTDLHALLARIDAATGPDRKVDLVIAEIFDGWVRSGNRWLHPEKRTLTVMEAPPHYTASLDATVALCERVLPGWRKQFWEQCSGRWHCRLIRSAPYCIVTTENEKRTRDGDAEIAGSLPTPALALLAAIVRAEIARLDHDTPDDGNLVRSI